MSVSAEYTEPGSEVKVFVAVKSSVVVEVVVMALPFVSPLLYKGLLVE